MNINTARKTRKTKKQTIENYSIFGHVEEEQTVLSTYILDFGVLTVFLDN